MLRSLLLDISHIFTLPHYLSVTPRLCVIKRGHQRFAMRGRSKITESSSRSSIKYIRDVLSSIQSLTFPRRRRLRFITALFTYLTANDATESFCATNFAWRALFRAGLKSHGPHTYIDFLFIGYNLISLNCWLVTK